MVKAKNTITLVEMAAMLDGSTTWPFGLFQAKDLEQRELLLDNI